MNLVDIMEGTGCGCREEEEWKRVQRDCYKNADICKRMCFVGCEKERDYQPED